VKLWRVEGSKRPVELDSRKLGNDDLFTVTLLQPGTYEVFDDDEEPIWTLEVDPRTPRKKQFRAPAPAIVDLGEESLSDEPAGRLEQTQTQVFRAQGRKRIRLRRVAEKSLAATSGQADKAVWRPEE